MAHLHFLGICGTFMGGLARLAVEMGHQVTGMDAGVYPPMSTQLASLGVDLIEGYEPSKLPLNADLYVVGNAISRGNEALECLLDRGLPYVSGPEWLAREVLHDKWVVAVAGTHGKTTTTSMLVWMLEKAGYEPGFLVGGVPGNLGVSARWSEKPFFVIEADEYDSAFFDKRSKMIHYRPRTLAINNLEYDHADIFPDLAAIQTQFHHLVRTIPRIGRIVVPHDDANLNAVLDRGVWCECQKVGTHHGWHLGADDADPATLSIYNGDTCVLSTRWRMLGEHNRRNALMAVAAANHVGVDAAVLQEALASFQGVARRMEWVGCAGGVDVYDDFAHHPTAIRSTLEGARRAFPNRRLIAVIDPRSNTMKQGVHRHTLVPAAQAADQIMLHCPESLGWQPTVTGERPVVMAKSVADLLQHLASTLRPGDLVISMSNGAFGQLPYRLLEQLKENSDA